MSCYDDDRPDDQPCSIDYYTGILDATGYLMNAIEHAYASRSGDAMPSPIRELQEVLMHMYSNADVQRQLWFMDHMGVKGDIAPEFRAGLIRARKEAGTAEG